MCCGKPTITVISMKERHNDKIEPHNHSEYLLLYRGRDASIKDWVHFRVPESVTSRLMIVSCEAKKKAAVHDE